MSGMIKKIQFLVPPHISYAQFVKPAHNERVVRKANGSFGSVLTDMPLGVMAMSSYLKKQCPGLETGLLDFNVLLNKAERFEHEGFYGFFKAALEGLRKNGVPPDVVGISALFTPAYTNMLDLARAAHEVFPGALVLAGGGVPTNLYGEIFESGAPFDALCYGEGEKPMAGLLAAADKTSYLEASPSWITPAKAKGGAIFSHDFITDLDEIPPYDYDICVPDDYGLNPAITAYAGVGEKRQNFHVMTSRGCPHHCCFCSSHTVHGRAMRYFSLGRVKSDLLRLKEKYGAKTVVFQDDHFVADKKRALAIIEMVGALNLHAVYQNGLALYALDKPMLEALKKAGADQLMLSVESGSARVLREIMHKPLDLAIVKRVAADCRELGIYTNVNLLIGLPGETKADIDDARAFLKTLDANWFLIFCANPLVGSEMMEICRKKNYLKSVGIESDYKKAVVETEDFTAEYIQEMAYIMNLELNFVHNSDFRLGEYASALKGFENAIRAKNTHALAYHYAALCHEKLGNRKKAEEYREKARVNAADPFWRKYVEMFKIQI